MTLAGAYPAAHGHPAISATFGHTRRVDLRRASPRSRGHLRIRARPVPSQKIRIALRKRDSGRVVAVAAPNAPRRPSPALGRMGTPGSPCTEARTRAIRSTDHPAVRASGDGRTATGRPQSGRWTPQCPSMVTPMARCSCHGTRHRQAGRRHHSQPKRALANTREQMALRTCRRRCAR